MRYGYSVTRVAEKLVLWRNEKGEVCCIADKCCHRGASLSCGKLVHGTTIGRGNKALVNGPVAKWNGTLMTFYVKNCKDKGQAPEKPDDISDYEKLFHLQLQMPKKSELNMGENLVQGDLPIIEFRKMRQKMKNENESKK